MYLKKKYNVLKILLNQYKNEKKKKRNEFAFRLRLIHIIYETF